MTHFSDGVQAGNLEGIYTGPQPNCTLCSYVAIPIALSANGIALTQSLAAAGALVLNGARVAAGKNYAQLDYPRRVTITSAGNDSGITFTVTGTDLYNKPMTQTLAGGNVAAVTTTKAFYRVSSVTGSGATAAAVTVGFNDAMGLPVRVPQAAYVQSVKWSTTLAQDAGTLVAADVTSPATAATGDVRGVYTPSSVADGVKTLVVTIAMPDPANQLATFGVKQV